MRTKLFKTVTIFQAFLLIIGLCTFFAPIGADAAGLGVSTSASYQSGVYYQRAVNAYNSNPDPRIRMVQIALSQAGYKGGTSSGRWAGNGGGGKVTEYGRYMKKDGLDWCASFVSWCAAAAGIPTSVIPHSASAGYWRNAGTGTYTPIWSNNYKTYNPYKPQVGDFCLYMPYCTNKNCGGHYNATSPTAHVVIVASVADQQNSNGSWTFTTIERGNGNTVASYKINTKMTRSASATCKCGKQPSDTPCYVVQGFWRPNWSLMSGSSGWNPSNDVITPSVALTKASQSEYVAKEFVTETNACVVTQITKPAGSSVTQCGLVLMDDKGNVLKNHSEDVSRIVGKNTTLFHSWYDINTELGYTLTKGTTYKYKFFAVVDGVRYEGETRSFTTKGQYTLYFDANGGSCSTSSKKLTRNSALGDLPTPVRDGYEFAGWYSSKTGGTRMTSSTTFTGTSDLTIYAQWTKVQVKTYTICYDANGGTGNMSDEVYQHGDTLTIKNSKFSYSGKEFYKWVLYRSADNKYYTSGYGWQTRDVINNNDYRLSAFGPGEKLVLDDDWTAGCNSDTKFYFIAVWQDVEEEEEEEDDSIVIKLYIDNSKMTVNGKSVNIDNQGTAPCLINGRTMIPIRALIEAMGGTVGWNETLQQVTLKLDGKTLYLRIGENYAFDNNEVYPLDSAPVLVNKRTLLPVRAVVEYFGGNVSWNNSTKCVTITYNK